MIESLDPEVIKKLVDVFAQFGQFAMMIFMTEAIVNTGTWIVEEGFKPKKVGALAVSIAIALLANLDIFPKIGIPLAVPYVGSVLSGVSFARGANVLHDLWVIVNGKSAQMKP